MKTNINWLAIVAAWAILGLLSMAFATNFGHNLCLPKPTSSLKNIYGSSPTGWGTYGDEVGCLQLDGESFLARVLIGPVMAFGDFPWQLATLYLLVGIAVSYLVLKKIGALGK